MAMTQSQPQRIAQHTAFSYQTGRRPRARPVPQPLNEPRSRRRPARSLLERLDMPARRADPTVSQDLIDNTLDYLGSTFPAQPWYQALTPNERRRVRAAFVRAGRALLAIANRESVAEGAWSRREQHEFCIEHGVYA